MTALIAAGALGFDISKLVFERQQVRAAVDAAAQIGAAQLSPSGFATTAAAGVFKTQIKNAAVSNYGSSTYGYGLKVDDVTVNFYCVVANTSGSPSVVSPNAAQIPSTCRPTLTNYVTGTKCGATSCAIPCDPTVTTAAVCNSIQVSATKKVQYVFGPAINIDYGWASAMTVSCRGSCGGQSAPNPMNVVVMADRTPSMWGPLVGRYDSSGRPLDSSGKLLVGDDDNLNGLRTGVENMLKIMTPKQQYVAFGAVHQSKTVATTGFADDLTQPLGSDEKVFKETTSTGSKCDTWKSGHRGDDKYCTHWVTTTTTGRVNQFTGTWVPVGFTKTYLDAAGNLNTNEDLYASVHNLKYSNLTTSGTNGANATVVFNKILQDDGTYDTDTANTHLASALKGAANYLLGNVDSTTSEVKTGLDSDGFRKSLDLPIKNVIILETDGQPQEVFNDAPNDSAAPLNLSDPSDIGATTNSQACKNFKTVADKAKAKGILIVTIGFGSANSSTCGGTLAAGSLLAYAASTNTSVTGTGTAESACSTPAQIAAENADSDYYFCASSATDLTSVFAAAMGNITKDTRFMSIDGVGD